MLYEVITLTIAMAFAAASAVSSVTTYVLAAMVIKSPFFSPPVIALASIAIWYAPAATAPFTLGDVAPAASPAVV